MNGEEKKLADRSSGKDSSPSVLNEFLVGLLDDQLDDAERLQLTDILRNDPAARSYYLQYMLTDAMLRLEVGCGGVQRSESRVQGSADSGQWPVVGGQLADQANQKSEILNRKSLSSPLIPPIVVAPAPRAPLFSLDSPLGSFLFSYSASAVVLLVALFLGLAFKMPVGPSVVIAQPNKHGLPAQAFVGHITDLADCKWSNPQTRTLNGSKVSVGRTYALTAGFLELTYDTGAKVILQGPCVYRVDSPRSGFLRVGKLTAKVGTRGEGRGTGGVASESRASNPQSLIPSPSSPSPLAPRPSPLFVITTPTAVVTDLGTEFGVEVKESGATRSHVFQGRIEVRSAGGGNEDGRSMLLGKGESVTVAPNTGRKISITHETAGTRTFVRHMPARRSIAVFNTGIGLRPAERDPHWQVVARSDDAEFKPRPARVSPVVAAGWLKSDPQRSQWISLDDPYFGDDVCYTFRTTFTLANAALGTATLQGRLTADSYVNAIRLNGRSVPPPKHGLRGPLDKFGAFSVKDGFVEGVNVLEFDVYLKWQGEGSQDDPVGFMGLRVELSGSYDHQESKYPKNAGQRAANSPRKGGVPAQGQ